MVWDRYDKISMESVTAGCMWHITSLGSRPERR